MDAAAPTAGKPTPPRRRWFACRYSLRTLLVMMTVACVVLTVWLNQLLRQRTAVRRFYELTARRPNSHGESLVTMGYRYDGKDQYYKPVACKWLHPLVGEEAFGEVTGVQLLGTSAADDDLRYLADVPTVERVLLSNTLVTDAGLVYLQSCPKLRMLTLDGLPITDDGLTQLLVLQDLESLSLNRTKITDKGLEQLAKLPKLKELWLRNTAITDAGYQRLDASLPRCEIQADVPAYYQKVQQLYWNMSPR
jgi:hypothetical protein